MLNVLTIDADYWFPLEQGGHCGRCPEQQHDRTRRVAVCKLFQSCRESRLSTEDERRVPTIAEIAAMVRPGTKIKVTESHAEMFFILYRAHLTGETLYVVNIDEHSDTGWCGRPEQTTVTTRGLMKTRYPFPVFVGGHPSFVGVEEVHCGVWAEAAGLAGWLRNNNYRWIGDEKRYAEWKSRGRGKNFKPDIVHVCRSAPYMSTRGDPHFADLVLALEEAAQNKASIYGHRSAELWRLIRGRAA